MSSRQDRKARRAAERAASKLQANGSSPHMHVSVETAGNPALPNPHDAHPTGDSNGAAPHPAIPSPSRLAGNRPTSQLSTEPRPSGSAHTAPWAAETDQTRDSTLEPTEAFPSRAREQAISQPTAISPSRLAANRANAQLSTGPKTESGKSKSSKNALKTALTGRTVLLPEDDADRYEQHLHHYKKAYEPAGERERELVQSLADTTWRIDRIPGIEEALYFKGSNEFAAEVVELDPHQRAAMLRMQTYLAYERQFRNLNIQEMRLHRLREKLIAEIKQLQKEREQKEKDDLAIAAKLYIAAKHDHKSFDPVEYGFDFSTGDVEAYLHGQRASFLTEKVMKTQAR